MTGLPAISLTEALEHPDLFAPSFRGSSWGPWKAFIATLFGEPLVFEALALYRHHTERTEPPVGAFREAAMVCGRRGGKTRVLALLAVYLGCFRDYTPYLAPGETPVIAVIAANRTQARVLLRYIAGLLRAVPLLRPLIADELAETIRLTNGVTVEIHTSSIASPRGRTFVAVLWDELAFWPATDDGQSRRGGNRERSAGPGVDPELVIADGVKPVLAERGFVEHVQAAFRAGRGPRFGLARHHARDERVDRPGGSSPRHSRTIQRARRPNTAQNFGPTLTATCRGRSSRRR